VLLTRGLYEVVLRVNVGAKPVQVVSVIYLETGRLAWKQEGIKCGTSHLDGKIVSIKE